MLPCLSTCSPAHLLATPGETVDSIFDDSDSIVDMPLLQQGLTAFFDKQCARIKEETTKHMPAVINNILCIRVRKMMAVHKQALQQVRLSHLQKQHLIGSRCSSTCSFSLPLSSIV